MTFCTPWLSRHYRLLVPLVICLAGMAVYVNSFSAPFYYDDFECIVNNPLIRSFSTLFELDRYREYGLPEDIRNSMVTRFIAYFTFAVNYRVHDLNVAGYHLVNLAIHLANGYLVYRLARLTWNLVAKDSETNWVGEIQSLLVALLFTVHPIQTNAVTYIVQRFSLLATLFYLFAVYSYGAAAQLPRSSRQKLYYGGALLTTALAMYTNEISFTLPVVITLYDLAFLEGRLSERLSRLWPFWATMVLLPVTVVVLAMRSTVTGGDAFNALELSTLSGYKVTHWDYFITQWRVIITYIRLMILPIGQNFDYDYPVYRTILHPQVFFSGLAVAFLSGVGFWLLLARYVGREINPYMRLAGFGIVWFFLTLVMTSSLIRLDDIIYEYRLYLPSFGFLIAIVAGSAWWVNCSHLGKNQRNIVVAVCCAAVVVLGILTIKRNQLWSDKVSFWRDVSNKSPYKARPLANLANELARQGNLAEALQLFIRAKELDTTSWIPSYQVGQLYLVLGNPAAARAELVQAAGIDGNQYEIWRALGYANLQLGYRQEAANAIQKWSLLCPADDEAVEMLKQLR